MTSVRLPENIDAKLEKLCAKTKRPKSFYIREALERYLEDISDYYIAMDRLANPGRLLTTKELLKELEKHK
ncbi:MAG: ribbon-helix-helix protein, CopG family [Alphaproteobacteria bacterium]|nr:ribbon-helix-helix protein, CopG family [Alphaproteobacteria bacterium]